MNLQEILSEQGVSYNKKNVGATYKWQVDAYDMWKKLNCKGKPNANWFRLFKLAYKTGTEGLIQSTYSSMADIVCYNPEYYFYKVFRNKKSELK